MDKRQKWKGIFLTIIGIVLTILALGAIYVGDSAIRDGQRLVFVDDAGDRLSATYYVSKGSSRGVMLLEGFGADQVTMRSAAVEFAQRGAHVFTFDFSGHGRSPGALGFDNASTDRLAWQVLAAKETFKAVSGLDDADIVMLGHSMGARVALQAATMDTEPIAGLILLGTQLNLATNVQSEFFTGVSDEELDWVQALGPDNPATDIWLISGLWDDILTPHAAGLLFGKLSGERFVYEEQQEEAETFEAFFIGDLFRSGSKRVLLLSPSLLHNYEIFSGRALTFAMVTANYAWDVHLSPSLPPGSNVSLARTAFMRIIFWIMALIGIFATLIGGLRWVNRAPLSPSLPTDFRIINIRRFLWGKLALWLAALPITALLFGVFMLVPLGLPAFNLVYVGFIGGYGVLMWILYRLGRMPGGEGRLFPGRTERSSSNLSQRTMVRTYGVSLGLGVALLAVMALYARTGWYLVPPVGDRLWWVFVFTPVTALGFWIGAREDAVMVQAAPERRFPRWALTLNGLVPFILWTLFQLALGSLSGMVGGAQGLVILALVLLYGTLLRRLGGSSWLTAVMQSVILYALILPQGVLFKI